MEALLVRIGEGVSKHRWLRYLLLTLFILSCAYGIVATVRVYNLLSDVQDKIRDFAAANKAYANVVDLCNKEHGFRYLNVEYSCTKKELTDERHE